MFDGVAPGVNISRRRKKSTGSENKSFANGYGSDSGSSDGSFVPAKRGKPQRKKPLRNINSYDSIQLEVTKEKQRKTPARRPRMAKGRKPFDDEEEADDPELKMSARMVDRIAALNDGKRTKVGMANCFEDRTALDCIDICLKESENMQEDAVALAIATAVYSLRVDRTHNDAQETRYTFIRGKSDAEKAMMLATDSNLENPKEKRKRRKAEKDAEARRMMEANDPDSDEQPMWMRPLEPDTFDYTFGMKFPVQGTSVQHWDFSQDLLDRIENRRVDVRKAKRRKKLIPWKKIIPLIYCPFYTDFELATAKIESDHFDALATFRARRDATGKQVMLHDSTARKSAPTSKYSNEVDLSVVRQSRDMLANCLRDEPTVWEHYLLEDNPQLYKTGQYLRTGDMTGYVLQERPFYHHFDPDKESADDPHDSYSFVEKNEDRTLYTFKKPPKGTALTRLAPLIRVPVNKYANPRNRNIEDFHFKEQIVLNPAEPDMHTADLKKLAEEVGKQIERENLELEESLSSDFSTSKANQDGENEAFSANNDSSVLSRLLAKHQQHSQDLERLRDELRQHARSCCSKTAKECVEWTDSLNKAALGEQVDDDELVDWKTSRFLETVGPLREKTFLETLKEKFALEFCEAETNSNTRRRTRVMTAIWGTGHNALELRVPDNAIFNNAFHFIKRGIHKDLQYVDATYHMKIFKFKVTVEQAHESLRRAERIGAGKSPAELAALKQKCFRPGRYQGIRDSGQVPKSYQLDPWSTEESTSTYSEQFFRCRDYPRMEGALLQLRNDIQEATKKIPKNSWYYSAVSEQETNDEGMDWLERLNEAITLFTTRVSKSEELELREKRALPKLVVRAVMQKIPTQDEPVLTSKAACESTTPDDGDAQPKVSDTEEQHIEEAPTTPFDEDITDFAYPEEDASGGIEEEMLAAVAKPVENTVEQSNEPECETTIHKTIVDDKEEPPKKRERRIKSEVDVKVEETEQEYFTKSGQHSVVPLRDRFKIVDPRTLVRSEDVIFMRRKPLARRVITEYKFEDFIKPGLLHKGRYPQMHLELKNQKNSIENIFNGILKKCSEVAKPVRDDMNNVDAELDVYDEWLATFGGFRIFYEEGAFGLDENEDAQHYEPLSQDLGFSDNENTAMHMDSSNHCSFNDSAHSFLSSGNTSRRDRFHDIRPDEYKAIGIDVKNIVPNKDFYSMTKEERAAAVAAEFEAIDALGPKKEDGYVISIMDFSCRVSSYHLNTARMKRVMKSILSNPLLAYDKVLYTRRALLRRRAVELNKSKDIETLDPNEVYYKKLDRSLDASLGPLAEKILEERNPMDITALDPIDVLEAVTYRNLEGIIDAEELSNNCHDSTSKGVEESMRQFAAEVRQADFKVQGLHTFSSVMQCLPRRMGNSGKYVNIANALAVTLYMCNENTLTLVQERTDTVDKNESVNEGEPWMGNFIITNAYDAALFQGNVLDVQDLSSPVDVSSVVENSSSS